VTVPRPRESSVTSTVRLPTVTVTVPVGAAFASLVTTTVAFSRCQEKATCRSRLNFTVAAYFTVSAAEVAVPAGRPSTVAVTTTESCEPWSARVTR
jgi:hypothetical protein